MMRFIAFAVLSFVLIAPESASACHRRRGCGGGQSNCCGNMMWGDPCGSGGSGPVMGSPYNQGQGNPNQRPNMQNPPAGSVAPMPNPKK